VPGLLLTMLGSTVLGITLLVRGSAPRLPALLLALAIPLAWLILQATSLGNAVLPVMFAFGILGRRLASGSAVAEFRPPKPQRASGVLASPIASRSCKGLVRRVGSSRTWSLCRGRPSGLGRGRAA
jgi:hypothetical protein